MEITKREVLASVSIVAVMLLIGFLISGKIQNSIMDDNEQYNKAVKIENEELFQYGMDTNVGDAFVYGDLEAVDTVTYPEIGGEYIFVKKVEERRERHEEKITEKDSKGKEHTRIRVYYEWETENVESLHAKEIKFCGSTFPYGKIDLPHSKHIKIIPGDKVYSWESGERVKVRFVYYGVKTKYKGTIFADLRNGTITNKTRLPMEQRIIPMCRVLILRQQKQILRHMKITGGLLTGKWYFFQSPVYKILDMLVWP